MSYKKFLSFVVITTLSTAMFFTGCANANTSSGSSTSSSINATATASDDSSQATSSSDYFTDRDFDYSYDASEATSVSLSDGETYTITEEGVYIFSGSVSNAQIVVDADDTAKVQIVLDGLTMTNDSTACIYGLNADKIFVTTADGSTNSLAVTGEFVAIDENNIDGVIFAKTDVTLNGGGTLTIDSAYGHGVVSKDDVKVTCGTLNISASQHGIQGKDSIRIGGGDITITSGEDGLHSSNDEDLDKGYVYLADGSLTISAGDDGIHANTNLIVDGGTLNITNSYEGLEAQNITVNGGDLTVNASDDGFNATSADDVSGQESAADMGMGMDVADGVSSITINGGTIYVNANGDGLDSNNDLIINGGTVYVDGPVDGANGALDYAGEGIINGGTFFAVGTSGMAMNLGSSSTQGTILVNLSSNVSGEIQLLDSAGNVLASYTPSKSYSSVVVSTAGIEDGATYTLVTGDSSTEITMDGLVYGNSTGMMGGFGGQMGGGQMGQMPSDGNFQPGQMPQDGQRPDGNFQPGEAPNMNESTENN